MTTDTSEKGLERLICEALTGAACEPPQISAIAERPAGYGAGWVCGDPQDYDREYCVDLAQLAAFLQATQPDAAESLDLGADSPARRRFLARLQGEVTKRGTIDVLRKGVKHGPHQIDLMYGTPSPGNDKAKVQYGQNRFSVTRQLRLCCVAFGLRPLAGKEEGPSPDGNGPSELGCVVRPGGPAVSGDGPR